MPRKAQRTPIPGFLLLLATCSEGSAADAGDRFFFAARLASTIPTAADFYNPLCFLRLPDTATTNGVDVPSACNRLVTLAIFLSETFRILATDQIPTGRESA